MPHNYFPLQINPVARRRTPGWWPLDLCPDQEVGTLFPHASLLWADANLNTTYMTANFGALTARPTSWRGVTDFRIAPLCFEATNLYHPFSIGLLVLPCRHRMLAPNLFGELHLCTTGGSLPAPCDITSGRTCGCYHTSNCSEA